MSGGNWAPTQLPLSRNPRLPQGAKHPEAQSWLDSTTAQSLWIPFYSRHVELLRHSLIGDSMRSWYCIIGTFVCLIQVLAPAPIPATHTLGRPMCRLMSLVPTHMGDLDELKLLGLASSPSC